MLQMLTSMEVRLQECLAQVRCCCLLGVGRDGVHSSSCVHLQATIPHHHHLSRPRLFLSFTAPSRNRNAQPTQTEAMPLEWVADIERSREKERRQAAREQKLHAQQEEHKARVHRALERAAAPVFQKTGKPQMARSALPKKRVVVERSAADEEEEELAAFLMRELL